MKYINTLLAALIVALTFSWMSYMIYKMMFYKPTPEEIQQVVERVEQNRKWVETQKQHGLR